MAKRPPKPRPQIAYSLVAAARACDIDWNHIMNATDAGELTGYRCGRKVLYLAVDLVEWIRRLPKQPTATSTQE
jgi:hypothetical protein